MLLGPDTTGTGAITNDDPQPTLTVADVTAAEASPAVFVITLSNPADRDVVVTYGTFDQSAAAPADYAARAGAVTILAGQTTATVTVPTVDDNTDEPDETFFLNILTTTNANLADVQGVGTITDNDNPPTVSVNDVTAAEGNAGTTSFAFTVTLSNPSSRTITVEFTTAPGSATSQPQRGR